MPITNDGTIQTLDRRVDMNGNIFVKVYAGVSMVKNTGILIAKGQYGYTSLALFNATTTALPRVLIGFPEESVATGSTAWAQIGGYTASAIISTTTATAGHMVKFSAGKLTTSGATAQLDNTFAAFAAAKTTSTVHALTLFPEQIKAVD